MFAIIVQVAAGLVLLVEQSRLDGNQAATLQLAPGHVLRLADLHLERVPLQELGACPRVDEVCVFTGNYQSRYGDITVHVNQTRVHRAYASGNWAHCRLLFLSCMLLAIRLLDCRQRLQNRMLLLVWCYEDQHLDKSLHSALYITFRWVFISI